MFAAWFLEDIKIELFYSLYDAIVAYTAEYPSETLEPYKN